MTNTAHHALMIVSQYLGHAWAIQIVNRFRRSQGRSPISHRRILDELGCPNPDAADTFTTFLVVADLLRTMPDEDAGPSLSQEANHAVTGQVINGDGCPCDVIRERLSRFNLADDEIEYVIDHVHELRQGPNNQPDL